MKKSDIFWQTYLNLEKEAIELSKYVYFTDEVLICKEGSVVGQSCKTQLETFSPYIADMLVQCCVQIEAISKEIYFENNGVKKRGDTNLFFDEDCLKLIDMKWKTHDKVVLVVAPFFNFTKNENRILKPLKEAHKRQGTYWEKAYQAVKHDRYYSLNKGNVKAFIHALAALYLLNIYYRNDSWVTSYEDIDKIDYSLGSAIFAVNSPYARELWEGNNPIESDSPFVVKYKDLEYKQIYEIKKKEEQNLLDYYYSQPEINELEFQNQIKEAEKEDGQNVLLMLELEKYKLNKKIPRTLSFEERKRILINSKEWNGWIHKHSKYILEDDLTADNIQEEINNVGGMLGIRNNKKDTKNGMDAQSNE